MDTYELLKLKLDRVIKMIEKFDELSEEEFSEVMSKIENISKLIPEDNYEKKDIKAYVNHLNSMNFKRYGGIFKGKSIKGSQIITKSDVENVVWQINSLLY